MIELRDPFGGEQVLLEGGGALEVGMHFGGHVGDDEAAEMLLVFERVLYGEDAAPGVAIKHEVFKGQGSGGPLRPLRYIVRGSRERDRRADRSCRSLADRSSTSRCRRREGRTLWLRDTRDWRPGRRGGVGP